MLKPTPIKTKPRPIAVKRQPTEAELKLRAILQRDARSASHTRCIAHLVGVYPA